MIDSKKQLKFYIIADRIMNGYQPRRTITEILKSLIFMGREIDYLRLMRKYEYYSITGNPILKTIYGVLFMKLGTKLGFSISYNSFGYGLVIPHYGTIVVGSNRIGNYAVLHTSTCIAGKESNIGDGLYMSPGAKITKCVTLGDAVTVGANSVVNKSYVQGHVLLCGSPARDVKDSLPWWERDGYKYIERRDLVEKIKSDYL